MKYSNIKYLSKPVSRIIMGTMVLNRNKLEQSMKLLDDMFALGVTCYDTASVYPNEGEAVMTQWIADRGIHDKVVLLTKGGHHNKWRNRVTPFDLMADLEDSLAKPGADYIDIFMLHRDDPAVPVSVIMDTLNRMHDAGKVQCFGASNWHYSRYEQANEYANKYGMMPFSAMSPNLSLAEQVGIAWDDTCITLTGDKNAKMRDWCEKTQTPVFAYSSLARGFMTGRFAHDEKEKAAEILDTPAKNAYLYDCNFERLRRAEIYSGKKNVSIAQTALAWVFHQGMNVFAIAGAESKEQMQANIAAYDLDMTKEDADWLNLK